MIKPEKKFLDLQVNLSATNSASATDGSQPINQHIQRGSAVYERIGNRTQMLYMQIQGYTRQGTLSDPFPGAEPMSIRFFVIYDRQPTGVNMTVGDFLRSSSASQSDADPVTLFTNVNNKQRFTVLLSKKIMLQNEVFEKADPGSIDRRVRFPGKKFSYFIKIPQRSAMSTYSASTGTIGDVSSGVYYLFAVSNGRNGTDLETNNEAFPTLITRVRMCYYG